MCYTIRKLIGFITLIILVLEFTTSSPTSSQSILQTSSHRVKRQLFWNGGIASSPFYGGGSYSSNIGYDAGYGGLGGIGNRGGGGNRRKGHGHHTSYRGRGGGGSAFRHRFHHHHRFG